MSTGAAFVLGMGVASLIAVGFDIARRRVTNGHVF